MSRREFDRLGVNSRANEQDGFRREGFELNCRSMEGLVGERTSGDSLVLSATVWPMITRGRSGRNPTSRDESMYELTLSWSVQQGGEGDKPPDVEERTGSGELQVEANSSLKSVPKGTGPDERQPGRGFSLTIASTN